jgi:NAD(P)-dependent dehydrogenase (short-subunit alcohol dehydrogenase family)
MLINLLASELGGLDVLVNNAGFLRGYPLAAPGAEAKAAEDVQVNVIGPVGELHVRKLPPAAVAHAIVGGLRRYRSEIRVGSVRQLAPLARIAPRLADRIVTRALTQE